MRRCASLIALGALTGLLASTPARAQGQKPSFFVGGGVTIPVGEYGDYAKTGWLGNAGVTVGVGKKGAWVGGEGFFGANKHSDVTGDKTNVYGAIGEVGYRFGKRAKAGVYVYGGAGFLVHQFKSSSAPTTNESEGKFAYTGAAGIEIPAGKKVSVWIESRYMGSSGTGFIPISIGLSFGGGS